MASEKQVRPLRVPAPSFDVASVHRPLTVLSLTGGGYRGLFTAQVLVELCDRARRPGRLDDSFDIFGGTSIGGLMACALAVGVPPRRVLDAIDAHGPQVFVKKRQRTLRRVFFGTLYDSDNLAKAIDDCLGRAGRTKLKNIEAGVVIPAVDWAKGTVQLFLSGAFGKTHASEATLRDVCLATSAAPTYFKPYLIDGAAMLDGGLARSAPRQRKRSACSARSDTCVSITSQPGTCRFSSNWTWPPTRRARSCWMRPRTPPGPPTAPAEHSWTVC